MAMDEGARHVLHVKLEQVLGDEEATTLMNSLPPVGWADVATKADLDQFAVRLRTEFQSEIGGLRAELQSEIGALRAELQSEVGGLHRAMGDIRAELHSEIGGLRGEVHAEIGKVRSEFSAQTRVLVLAIMGSNATLAAVAFAAARLV